MPMKRTPRQRKAAEERKRLAHQAARREEHARLVNERTGDPGFVQRQRTQDGDVVLSWDVDSRHGDQMRKGLAGQQEAFRTRFGRDPGPEDPIFFDPAKDDPTPLGEPQWEAHFEEMAATAAAAGLDPAFIRAWREVGYIVTEANRHLFSVAEVDAYLDAVARHQDGDEGDLDDDTDDRAALGVVADGLRAIVAQIVGRRSVEPAWVLARAADATDEPEAQQLLAVSGFGILVGWLTGAREAKGADIAVPALSWIRTHLGDQQAQTALPLAGLVGHPDAPDLTLNQALDAVGDDALPALLWLTAGIVATALNGDAERLAAFDPDFQDG